jgi:5-formyltetrahydrofolate cyclo-ligase
VSDISVPPPHADDPAGAKAQMRKQAAKIRQQEADNHPDAAERLAGYCHLLLDSFGRGVYAAYLPIRSEISPLPLIAALHDAGQATAMPVTPTEGQPLSFRLWAVGDVLEDGPYGTRQPPVGGKTVVPDVILAPLLAFDLGGWRLGYGGGFYDRTIADFAARGLQASVVGLAYDGQKLDKVPVGTYDMPLDAVLSPSGLHRPQR